MMGKEWVVLFVALLGSHLGYGLPIGSTPQSYFRQSTSIFEEWGNRWYAAVPALALVLTALGLIFGCTWCHRHKDCKIFTASATQLNDGSRRSQPPDSGFSEPINNNISEDNNNGPISLREMQNIANNNAAAYIVSENEERNRAISRESVVEFEPLPAALGAVADPLERCVDWFGAEDFPRNRLQYLREIGRGWFGRIVEGEIENGEDAPNTNVAVKILNQNASLEDKARFLDEARLYRDVRHENVLRYISRCLREDPWVVIFELCSMDLQEYLQVNRPKMASLNEKGVPLRIQCDVASALSYLHSQGLLYGNLWSGNVLVRGADESARGVVGRYADAAPHHECAAPELSRRPIHTASTDIWSLGVLLWEVCSWGATPTSPPLPEPVLPCPYRAHLYQVMQLCCTTNPEARPTAAQVHTLLNHLHTAQQQAKEPAQDDGYASSDFEDRWQRLKPNSIPKIDEHVAIVHAPSTSTASHFTGSEQEYDNSPTVQDTLSVDLDTAVSRSSSIMSDKDPLSVQVKSESLTNLHGSLEDVRNIYLTHNEAPALECHQANLSSEDIKEKEQDRSDSSVDPWLKEIIAGSQDDVSYYKDVSDVIKNLDNILNSEKTSSSESSHQASPSRDNLSLDCKKDYQLQSSLVKSPGISNFQNILDVGFENNEEKDDAEDDDVDRDTIGTLSHSFERHSDTISQQTLANLTPDTPIKDICEDEKVLITKLESPIEEDVDNESRNVSNVISPEEIEKPNISEAAVFSNSLEPLSRVSEDNTEHVETNEDCQPPCDNQFANTDTHEPIIVKSNNVSEEKLDVINRSIATDVPSKENFTDISNIIYKELAINGVRQLNSIVEDFIHQERKITDLVLKSNLNESSGENSIKSDMINADNDEAEGELRPNLILAKIKTLESNSPILGIDGLSDERTVDHNDILLEFTVPAETQDTVPSIGEELLFEDKIISEGENLVDAINENSHSQKSNEFLSTLDILPDITEDTKMPSSEEYKDKSFSESLDTHSVDTQSTLPLEKPDDKVQNIVIDVPPENIEELVKVDINLEKDAIVDGSFDNKVLPWSETTLTTVSDESTMYMDLIDNDADCTVIKDKAVDNNVKEVIKSCMNRADTDDDLDCTLVKNGSTVYMDLPNVESETHKFLDAERVISDDETPNISSKEAIPSSTPKGNDLEETLERTKNARDVDSSAKIEQKFEISSPFESPTKSHPTDTFDENSSVVLGPFENYSLELFKSGKSGYIEIDVPKEELLAFSSNFSEINLETPSPLRDVNFLNEVPDIEIMESLHLEDNIATTSEAKVPLKLEAVEVANLDLLDGEETERLRGSPSTPPNSPGNFLASTSQQNFAIEVDNAPPMDFHNIAQESDPYKDSIYSNRMNQMATRLAMAENENNLNIEYSGPLVEDPVTHDEMLMGRDDVEQEVYLTGNGTLEPGEIDEERMQALRNELELRLPLAQVASIQPSEDVPAWTAQELVVNYSGALSPIAEETGHQLAAYENDRAWTTSVRTDSSESYLEPCNNSTDEVTDIPTATGQQSTYTIESGRVSPSINNNTFTIQKDRTTSKEITMSEDSLNAVPVNLLKEVVKAPINDATYNKEDEKESHCERLSQVSPYILSPTTDTTAPENSDITGISNISKTTVPTDAKSSKPSETQCFSKATSIDSWCSNDTLFNVEDHFDDLAMDPDVPLNFEDDNCEHTASTATLTHNDDNDVSYASDNLPHDSKSEHCETFTPDSVTANCTYTKIKTETTCKPSSLALTDVNDSSTKNSQTKDLAYGTLLLGVPSYSNCTTEFITTNDDLWRLPQPELVRRLSLNNDCADSTQPQFIDTTVDCDSPKLQKHTSLNKMDSVDITEISCLTDPLCHHDNMVKTETTMRPQAIDESPEYHFRNMANSKQSTPISVLEQEEDVQPIPLNLPVLSNDNISSEFNIQIPTLRTFIDSAEMRQQDMASNQDTAQLLEGESTNLSRNNECPSAPYLGLNNTALNQSRSSQRTNVVTSPVEAFSFFENSIKNKPQDISSIRDATVSFLQYEISHNLEAELSTLNDNLEQTNKDSLSEVGTTKPLIENTIDLNVEPVQLHFNSANTTTIENSIENTEKVSRNNCNDESDKEVKGLAEISSEMGEVITSERVPLHINNAHTTTEEKTENVSIKNGIDEPNKKVAENSELNTTEHVPLRINNASTTATVNILENIENISTKNGNDEPNIGLADSPCANSKIITTEQVPLQINNTHSTEIENLIDNTENVSIKHNHDETNEIVKGLNDKSGENSEIITNFHQFMLSAELRPQDISSRDSESALEIESISKGNSSQSYSDFENSARNRAQDVDSKFSQSTSSITCNDQFKAFESSAAIRPQDISTITTNTSNININISTEPDDPKTVDSKEENVPTQPNNFQTTEPPRFLESIINYYENEQPHSIIITEEPSNSIENGTFNSHLYENQDYISDLSNAEIPKLKGVETASETIEQPVSLLEITSDLVVDLNVERSPQNTNLPHGSAEAEANCNGKDEKYATVNFINESFEELIESNVDDSKEGKLDFDETTSQIGNVIQELVQEVPPESPVTETGSQNERKDDVEERKVTSLTESFLDHEKRFCQLDGYLPQLLSDIRFTGPTSEIMSTSFSQESPSEPTPPTDDHLQSNGKQNGTASQILKDWESDSDDSQSSNPSSGEFIWKQREHGADDQGGPPSEGGSEGSGDSGSGSEGDEVEFVPSSWDCRAAPSKSSLRSLEQAQPESKKRVVFKRQKYHCVYEYPREVTDPECEALTSPAARLPDYSTYADWAAAAAEEAELSYNQLYGGHPFDMSYPLRAGIAYGTDYDEDFFISSSAHPFECLGIMSSTSQFFPGMHGLKAGAMLSHEPDLPPPPSPPAPLPHTTAPSLDFVTPDSGVEDITPGYGPDEDLKPIAQTQCWKTADSASSSESVSPSSPGGETLGGLRHTRDKLKLDLPPSPHVPSPRHNRVFSFVLDKPKPRHRLDEATPSIETPLVMTDETPNITTSLPLQKEEEPPLPPPTFSTFGKNECGEQQNEKAIVLTDEAVDEADEDLSKVKVETVKGEGTVLDSGDEDSGIESAKATLDRKHPNVS